MLGNGWFTNNRLAKEMGITGYVASQTIQAVRRSPLFDTEEELFNGKVHVKVTYIHGKRKKLSRETVFFRAVVFGETIPEECK